MTVDSQVITASQLTQEIRVTAFINDEKPDLSSANRRKAANRLVEQALIKREMELAHYPEPPESDVDKTLQQVKSRFPDGAQFRNALQQYGIIEADLRQFLFKQAAALQFIEYRFRPEVFVTELEIRACYENQVVPAYQKQHGREPSFDEARSQCEEMIAARRVDQLVDQWMKDARSRADVVYQEDAFL